MNLNLDVTIYRREHFCAAHRLHNPNWTAEKNRAVFGKCNGEHFHGHNYSLEVSLTGPIDPETGYVFDTGLLSTLIHEQVLEKFDHRNLNLDVPEFQQLNPTTENIATIIYKLLKDYFDSKYRLGIRLYETERNYVDYPGRQ